MDNSVITCIEGFEAPTLPDALHPTNGRTFIDAPRQQVEIYGRLTTSEPVYSDEAVRTGSWALKCAPSATDPSALDLDYLWGSSSTACRFYVLFETLPTTGPAEVTNIFWEGGVLAAIYYDPDSGRLRGYLSDEDFSSFIPDPIDYSAPHHDSEGPAIETGRWYRIDIRCTGWVYGREMEWRVDGVACPTLFDEPDVPEGDLPEWYLALPYSYGLGSLTTNACVMYFDDYVVSSREENAYADPDPATTYAQRIPDTNYPIGPGYVLGHLLNGVGTHNPGSGGIVNDDGSALDADSWQRLTDWPANPPASWDGIKQVNADATAYAEFTLEDADPSAVLTAFVIMTWMHSVGGQAVLYAKAFYDGAELPEGVGVQYNDASGFAWTSDYYSEGGPVSGGTNALQQSVAIDPAKFNAMTIRIGYSTDATPDALIDAVMVQAAYSTENATYGGALDPGLTRATLAHVIVADDGRACYPLVGDFEAQETTSLGQIGGGCRISREFYERHRDVITADSELWTYIRETGEVRFWMRLYEPSIGPGPVEIRGEGAAALVQAASGRWFYSGYGAGYWITQEIQDRAKAPKSAVAAADDGAGNVNAGVHRYKVTFVTDDGETRPGPRFEIDLNAGGARKVALTSIPKGKGFVTARKIYRTQAGGSTYGLLATIADNTTTTYSDNTADGGLGAAPPSSFEASAIEVEMPKGAIKFHVPKGSDITDGQRAAVIFPLPGDESVSGIELDVDKTTDTGEYVLKVQKADDEDSGFTTVETLSLDDDGDQRPFVEISGGPGVIRLLFQKVSTDTDLDAFTLTLSRIRVFGRAPDEDFTTSDVIGDVLEEVGVSDELVDESGLPAMPADFPSANGGEVAHFEAIMTGWPIVLRKEGLNTVGVFRPYGERTWRLVQPESIEELDALPPYNHVRAIVREEEGEIVDMVELFDENPAEDDRVTFEVALNNPGTKTLVKHFVGALADVAFTTRYVGRIACTQLIDENGVRWHTNYAYAGDSLWHPGKEVSLPIVGVNLNESLPELIFDDPIVAMVEEFNRRQERRLALKSR